MLLAITYVHGSLRYDTSLDINKRRTASGTRHDLANALRRDADYLARHPDAMWQQFFNRLQWEPEPIPRLFAPEFQRRTAPDATPWFWLRTPPAESPALARTLHSGIGSQPSRRLCGPPTAAYARCV